MMMMMNKTVKFGDTGLHWLSQSVAVVVYASTAKGHQRWHF